MTSKFPEYYRAYDRTSIGYNTSNFEYSIDISRNIINGQRYYIRYCVVSASGDTSEYTQVTSSNLLIVSCVPGKLPVPPQIFRASSADRKVRLYFDWNTNPPSIELTGGLPILNYRIIRYERSRQNDVITILPDTYTVLDNITGTYYEDTYEITSNGVEYEYRIYSRTAFGVSINYNSTSAIPSRPTDVIRNVSSYLNNYEITLYWDNPETLEPESPITQYYIEYKEFNIFNTELIPSGNIYGFNSGENTISVNIRDMNRILVNDVLWDSVKTTVIGLFTNSNEHSYTISGLSNKPFLFRVAAVTRDPVRRRIIGLRKVIGSNTPYLPHPVIIGKIPSKLSNDIEYINDDTKIIITWTTTDIYNTENIIRFIVDYDIAVSDSDINAVYSQRQTFEYENAVFSYDGSSTRKFQIIVTGLNNNVPQRPDPKTNSYVMKIYAENRVSFTNDENKIKLHELKFKDIFEGNLVPRVLRPRTIPTIIDEVRT
jgi:hypothetical protein